MRILQGVPIKMDPQIYIFRSLDLYILVLRSLYSGPQIYISLCVCRSISPDPQIYISWSLDLYLQIPRSISPGPQIYISWSLDIFLLVPRSISPGPQIYISWSLDIFLLVPSLIYISWCVCRSPDLTGIRKPKSFSRFCNEHTGI